MVGSPWGPLHHLTCSGSSTRMTAFYTATHTATATHTHTHTHTHTATLPRLQLRPRIRAQKLCSNGNTSILGIVCCVTIIFQRFLAVFGHPLVAVPMLTVVDSCTWITPAKRYFIIAKFLCVLARHCVERCRWNSWHTSLGSLSNNNIQTMVCLLQTNSSSIA